MGPGGFRRGLSRNRVIFHRNSRHYRKVASHFAKVSRFIVPLAIGVRRILNSIGEVPPLGAKVTCFLGPLAALPGSGRPGVAGGRPGIFRFPGEAPFP